LPGAELRERLVRLTGIASGPSPCADDDGSLPLALLRGLGRNGARLLRGPIRVAQLRRSIEDFLAIGAAETRTPEPLATGVGRETAARIFDDVQLGRLLETTSSVDCECPSHVAALVASMGAFERYSYDCESRNTEDELLHRRLAVSSARIRADLEQLLLAVCRHERLPI